jgi:hypothetical protein
LIRINSFRIGDIPFSLPEVVVRKNADQYTGICRLQTLNLKKQPMVSMAGRITVTTVIRMAIDKSNISNALVSIGRSKVSLF